MGDKASRQRSRKPTSDASENESSPAGSSSSKNSRESTDCCGPENIDRGPDTSRSGESGTPIYRDAAAQYGTGQRERDDPDRGYVNYDSGPDPQRLSDRYGFDVRGGQARTLQRLENEFWTDQVRRWAHEGMTVETMGKPRDMQAFRERQAERPKEVPTDIERQNEASLRRNTATNPDERSAGDAGVPDVVRSVVSSPGRSLDETVQREMETKMGGNFGDVRIHTGPHAAAAADAINARAFTVGNHVAFNRGEYKPKRSEGKRVLAHELTHVRQQTDGAVSMLPKAEAHLAIDPDPKLEREAEETAREVTDNHETVTRMGTEMHVQRVPGTDSVQSGFSRDEPLTIQRDTKTKGEKEGMTEEATEKAQKLINQAQEHYGAGEYRKAVILFERVRNMSGLSTSAEAKLLYNIGVCNLRLRRYATAITYFQQYLDLSDAEDKSEAKAKLKEAKRGAGIPTDETEETEEEMTEEATEKARKLFNQAQEHYGAGKYRKAIVLFERVRNMSGLSTSAEAKLLYDIGVCNLRLRRFATAITYFQQYLDLSDAKNKDEVKAKLKEAKRGAGVPTDETGTGGAQAKFEPGTTVKTTSALRIRDGPGTDYASQATAPEGVTGAVVEGPEDTDSHTWWKIEYDAGYTGWSAQPWLTTPEETGTAGGGESASIGDQQTVSTETGGSGSATQTGGGTSAGGASSTTPESGTATSEGIDIFEDESEVDTEYYDHPRKVTTFVAPDMVGDEEAVIRASLDLYFFDNFRMLMSTQGMEPIVDEIYKRILIPIGRLPEEPTEGDIVGFTIPKTVHKMLSQYYYIIKPHLEDGDIERAKYMGRLYLPQLEPLRTGRKFAGGFRKFRLRAINNENINISRKVSRRSRVKIEIKALLYELEEKGPGKGPLKRSSEGIPSERASPPDPRKKRIGYVGFGPALAVEVRKSVAVETIEKIANELKPTKWNTFTTPVHMRLEDFEGVGGVAGAGFGIGNVKSMHFDCPELENVAITVEPGWSWKLDLGIRGDLTGGYWELDPDLGGIGAALQEMKEVRGSYNQ